MTDAAAVTATIDILRHAECEGGAMFRGMSDVPLSAEGWTRLHRVTAPLSGWCVIVTSPLRRCQAFADELAAARGIPVTADQRLREMDFGDWEGELIADIWTRHPDAAWAWYHDPEHHAPPNAEPLSAVRARVAAAWDALVETHKGGHILVLTHGGVIRNLIVHALDLPPAATNRFSLPYGCRAQIAVTHADGVATAQLMGLNMDSV